MERRIAITIVCAGLVLGGLLESQAGATTKSVSAFGGSVTFTYPVKHAKTCSWSSSPNIAGFAKTVKCGTGNVVRTAKFAANKSANVKSYDVMLTARGGYNDKKFTGRFTKLERHRQVRLNLLSPRHRSSKSTIRQRRPLSMASSPLTKN